MTSRDRKQQPLLNSHLPKITSLPGSRTQVEPYPLPQVALSEQTSTASPQSIATTACLSLALFAKCFRTCPRIRSLHHSFSSSVIKVMGSPLLDSTLRCDLPTAKCKLPTPRRLSVWSAPPASKYRMRPVWPACGPDSMVIWKTVSVNSHTNFLTRAYRMEHEGLV